MRLLVRERWFTCCGGLLNGIKVCETDIEEEDSVDILDRVLSCARLLKYQRLVQCNVTYAVECQNHNECKNNTRDNLHSDLHWVSELVHAFSNENVPQLLDP